MVPLTRTVTGRVLFSSIGVFITMRMLPVKL